MKDFLVQHARSNVWCTPYQDRQALLQMSRVTPIGGVKGSMDFGWDRINMPTADAYYHVYQIGNNYPPQLNLPTTKNTWISVSDLCVKQRQVMDVFLKDGREYPRSTTWIGRTWDRNYIVATQIHSKIDLLDTQDLMIRFYSNAYFHSSRSTEATLIEVGGGKMANTAAIAALTTAFKAAQQRATNEGIGFVYAFHNGEYVSTFDTTTVKVGDIVEYVYDVSVYRVIDFPLSSLTTFDSTLDNLRKYLIHPNKADDTQSIQYQDDIDVFLYKKDTTGRVKGIYYYRSTPQAVRMVTHADYAIPTQVVQSLTTGHQYWGGDTTGLVVRVQMRKSGYDRPLVFEHHRIHELYKLSDVDIVNAMQGINATVPEWQAASLEASSYTFIMRAYWGDVTLDRVLDAYGYNATAKLVGDTPQRFTVSGPDRFVVLPPGLQTNATVYEFDSEGQLLDWHIHRNGGRYYANSADAVSVEVISGIASKTLNLVKGSVQTTLDPNCGYRLYVSPKLARVTTNEWVEIDPSDTTHVQVLDGVVYWVHDTRHWEGAVKQDDRFLAQTYSLASNTSLFQFSLTYTDVAGTILYITPGRIDLWLNKQRMIEGIDYYVNYPQITLVNKEWLTGAGTEIIDVRAYGFCLPTMARERSKQVGFVENGMLSYNSSFDLRDDRVIQITVDGGSVLRDDVTFAEDQSARVGSQWEGRPYEISDIVVPIRGVSDYDTYVLRDRSLEVDARVSDYLTMKFPQVTFPDAPDIVELYKVYSPFMNRLILDIVNGVLSVPTGIMTDKQVLDSTANYRSILAYDPCLLGLLDSRYMVIHPVTIWTTYTVTQNEYSYLERVISLLLQDQVDLTPFLKIED